MLHLYILESTLKSPDPWRHYTETDVSLYTVYCYLLYFVIFIHYHNFLDVRRIEKIGNALQTQYALEDFYDGPHFDAQINVQTLVIPVNGIYDVNAPPEIFYTQCLENVKKAWPGVKLIHLQGGEYIYYPDNAVSMLKSYYIFGFLNLRNCITLHD